MDHKIKNASEGIAPMGISALNETVLSNQPESRYECPVCLNWLRDPVITTCGHKFCKKCITSWNSGHCPIDNINLSMKVDIFPDNYTKREIQEQRMSCPFAAKGCSVKVTPLDLDSHISTCEYNQPEASHQSDITIPCSFKAVGCKETFDNQEDLNNHLHNDILTFAVAKMKQNNDMLLRYCMGNYIWKIDNFQARLDAMLKDHYKMLYSPGFYTSPNGYRFCVRLNISPQNPQCFALHVHLMKTEYDDCLDWPFNGRIAFSMINQYNPELTQRDTMMSNSSLIAFRKPTAEICLRGFGYTEYALVSDVIRNGFVKDDVLIVKVSIRCV
ncbi:unnamed protein product [Leptidea sinapis]|uniref:RING-type E3 ubiquitin transferase n=1 Tax=Leptidea sinapis TaxID=189913 RepID=A0A5E4Q4Q2_9NEOP|nr:unnamed protein product [Leptidea sinapis]